MSESVPPRNCEAPIPRRPGARVQAVDFGFRHAGRKNPALVDVNFTIEPGEKVLLLGASGSGKSTLLAGLAGVLGDGEDGESTGQLLIDDQPAEAARGVSGLVLQDPDSQVISSRVGDDIAFGCENLGVDPREIWNRVEWARSIVGLEVGNDHPTAELSGGQKQRLALAGVLAMGAGLILLDEPTANIDPDGVHAVRRAVCEAASATGATVVIVEHRVDIWKGVVDKVVVVGRPESLEKSPGHLSPGASTVVADGPLEETVNAYGDALAKLGVWMPGVGVDIDPIRKTAHTSQVEGAHGGRAELRTGSQVEGGPVEQSGGTARPRTEALLSARNLDIGWSRTAISRGINLDFDSQPTVITGENGAGKSTLALTMAGLLAPLGGEVTAAKRLTPRRRRGAPHSWKSTELTQRIGTVFQDPEHQFVARTVYDELMVGPRLTGLDADQAAKRCDRLLERLQLSHLAKANPFTLSGGQKRRLSVATMLMTAPSILILDEPTFGQDRTTFTQMILFLREMADEGAGVIAVTHDPLVVAHLGERHLELGRKTGITEVEVRS